MAKHAKAGLFYKVLLGIAAVLLALFLYVRFGMLRPWLTRYEASQPKHACQEIFQDLFAPTEGSPDWGRIYDLAQLENTAYQGRETFVRSMEELTGGEPLTYVETSAGLSGDRRYIVKSGGDSIAAFTLTNRGQDGAVDWQLASVEMLLGKTSSVTIRAAAGYQVLAGGQQLDESCQVQTIETAAERYLPEGVHGRRLIVWQTAGGLAGQDVTVLDQAGQTVPLTYNAGLDCFEAAETQPEPGEAERALALGAAQVYARFMIREASAAQLQSYFDASSQIYRTIRSSEIWMQHNYGYSFSDEAVDQYYQYGDDLFSIKASLVLSVKRSDGSAKTYPVDSTFFFHRVNGAWRAFEMTNVDVQEEIVRSRLVFMDGEAELGRLFVSSQDRSFTPPAVDPPAGQRFAGWAVREQSGSSVTMTIRFQPGEDGTVALPEGYALEPMTLYAVCE